VSDHPRLPQVSVQRAEPRGIAAVRAKVPVGGVPAVFGQYLNQVYAAAKTDALPLDGQNIFVYRACSGAELDVEFGVGVSAPFSTTGGVAYSPLPVGEVATATHWGDYSRIREAHQAVTEWCRENGRALTGTSWEIYGHWVPDVTRLRTDVYYLLAPRV
jgi:effector-binding domain-containing protein